MLRLAREAGLLSTLVTSREDAYSRHDRVLIWDRSLNSFLRNNSVNAQNKTLVYLFKTSNKGRYVFNWGGGWTGVFQKFLAKKVVALPVPGMD